MLLGMLLWFTIIKVLPQMCSKKDFTLLFSLCVFFFLNLVKMQRFTALQWDEMHLCFLLLDLISRC